MLHKKFVPLFYTLITLFAIAGIVSCEKDLTNIGVDMVDNQLFNTSKYQVITKGWSTDILSNRTDNLTNYYLGYLETNRFGSLRASLVGQLTLPQSNPSFGENAAIDSVIITFPYFSTLNGKKTVTDPALGTINVPDYELDSLWTSGLAKFQLKVWELGTYLNPYSITNPSVANEFYSDNNYIKLGTPLFDQIVTPSPNDTMSVIKRKKYIDAALTTREVYKTENIKLSNAKPSLKITIDSQYAKSIFQDNAAGTNFDNNDNFRHFFRGFYFEALPVTGSNALVYLNTSEANMTIYYTETRVKNEGADEDLNGNGIKGEQGVLLPYSNSFVFPLTGIKSNLYDRNHNSSLAQNYIATPNSINGEDKLFVNGTAGTDAVVNLFGNDANNDQIPDQLAQLRTKNWIINDAQLYLYVDKTIPNYDLYCPEKLYIYRIKDNEKLQTLDINAYNTLSSNILNIEGINVVDGKLYYDSSNKPDYYRFRLTKYLAEITKPDTEEKITNFGIKTLDSYDVPTSVYDSIMRKYNTNFKGVVLQGNSSQNTDRNMKLEIYYTEKN